MIIIINLENELMLKRIVLNIMVNQNIKKQIIEATNYKLKLVFIIIFDL